MLVVVESPAEIEKAQVVFERNLKRQNPSRGVSLIGYPGGSQNVEFFAQGVDLPYFAPRKLTNDQDGGGRFWNAFGNYSKRTIQHIVVEINVSLSGHNRRVAGFLARDQESGATYIMHSGKIGGGRKGIGKNAFLEFISDEPVEAMASDGVRRGLRIAEISDPGLASLVFRFVTKVDEFKRFVTDPEFDASQLSGELSHDDDFRQEFSGRKRGRRKADFDYETYHGMVVDALKAEHDSCTQNDTNAKNDRFIDLCLKLRGKLVAVFEVKTKCDRQSLHTAIGQLMTHGRQSGVTKHLVVPADGEIPNDCEEALELLAIKVRRFRAVGDAWQLYT